MEARLNRICLCACAALVMIPAIGLSAAVSRTTEYHQLATQLGADKVLNIVLPDGVFLSGYVKDQSGKPVVDASVGAALTDNIVPTLGGGTDSTGKFSIPVQAGMYDIYVTPPTSASVTPSQFSRLVPTNLDGVSVAGDTSAGTITMPSGNILSGKVLPPSGSMSLFGGVLWTFPTNGGTVGYHAAQFGSDVATSAQYAIALSPGSYKAVLIPIQVFSSTFQPLPAGYTTSKFTISGDKTLNLKLKKGYKLSGTVRDSGGRGLDGIVWIFQKTAQFVVDVYVGFGFAADGVYETYIPNGSYTVVFVPLMDTSYKGRGASTAMDLVMPAAAKTLDIAANDGIVLSGKVTDAKKKVAKEAGVLLRDTTDNPWGANQVVYAALASTNSKGQYRVAVPSGTYDIMASPNTGESKPIATATAGIMMEARRQIRQMKAASARHAHDPR